MSNYSFERVTPGTTIKVKGLPVEGHDRMYITVNSDYKIPLLTPVPCEIFARYDSPDHFELINVITRLASMSLREGVPLEIIARELKDIHSPKTFHIIPGTSTNCPSITARIGEALENYLNQKNKNEQEQAA